MRGIVKFALWGGVGFGVGGAIGGIIAVETAILGGFAIMGGSGGMSLGLALKSWKMAGLLALAGMVGLSLGAFISVFIGLSLGEILPLPNLFWTILGRLTITGTVAGLALGLPLKSWKAAGFLALAGAIAFLIVEQVQKAVPLGLITPQLLSRITQMVIWGIIGGALWGGTLGYLKR